MILSTVAASSRADFNVDFDLLHAQAGLASGQGVLLGLRDRTASRDHRRKGNTGNDQTLAPHHGSLFKRPESL